MVMMVAEQFNYRKNPYRGIISEIAKERGVTRQAVQSSLKKGNPFIREAVTRKIEERRLMVQEFERLMNQGSDGEQPSE